MWSPCDDDRVVSKGTAGWRLSLPALESAQTKAFEGTVRRRSAPTAGVGEGSFSPSYYFAFAVVEVSLFALAALCSLYPVLQYGCVI